MLAGGCNIWLLPSTRHLLEAIAYPHLPSAEFSVSTRCFTHLTQRQPRFFSGRDWMTVPSVRPVSLRLPDVAAGRWRTSRAPAQPRRTDSHRTGSPSRTNTLILAVSAGIDSAPANTTGTPKHGCGAVSPWSAKSPVGSLLVCGGYGRPTAMQVKPSSLIRLGSSRLRPSKRTGCRIRSTARAQSACFSSDHCVTTTAASAVHRLLRTRASGRRRPWLAGRRAGRRVPAPQARALSRQSRREHRGRCLAHVVRAR